MEDEEKTYNDCLEDYLGALRPYNMEMLPFFVSKSMPDSEVITVWRLRGDFDKGLVCPIKLEGS
jgi:hypothetical protein